MKTVTWEVEDCRDGGVWCAPLTWQELTEQQAKKIRRDDPKRRRVVKVTREVLPKPKRVKSK